MKKCPDCGKDVQYGREYCQHCSAALFGKLRVRHEANTKLMESLFNNNWKR